MVNLKVIAVLLFLLSALAGCTSVKNVKCDTVTPLKTLPWLKAIVAEMEQDPVANNDAEIHLYTYYNRPVFYVFNRCCDIPATVYDCNGNKLCEPIAARLAPGEKPCTDFFAEREAGRMLWPVKDKKMSP